jgi:hypothetical protein
VITGFQATTAACRQSPRRGQFPWPKALPIYFCLRVTQGDDPGPMQAAKRAQHCGRSNHGTGLRDCYVGGIELDWIEDEHAISSPQRPQSSELKLSPQGGSNARTRAFVSHHPTTTNAWRARLIWEAIERACERPCCASVYVRLGAHAPSARPPIASVRAPDDDTPRSSCVSFSDRISGQRAMGQQAGLKTRQTA